MRGDGQLSLFLGVFVVGGLGGAGLLHAVSGESKSDASLPSAQVAGAPARPNGAVESEADQRRLEELKDALHRLGVRTDVDPNDFAPANDGALDGDALAADADVASEPITGESAAEVLARLEREYKAVLATRHEEAAPPLAPVAARATSSEVPPVVSAPVQQAVASRETNPVPAEDVRLASNTNVQVVHGDVVAGDVHTTTVNETHTNQVAINQYQQLILVSPGAITGQRYAPTSQPPRQRGASPQDSNPWAGVDYGAHYANPWGSTFGRRP